MSWSVGVGGGAGLLAWVGGLGGCGSCGLVGRYEVCWRRGGRGGGSCVERAGGGLVWV